MRRFYDIPENVETRVWYRYSLHRYERLKDPQLTLQDAGLANGQVHTYESHLIIACKYLTLYTGDYTREEE